MTHRIPSFFMAACLVIGMTATRGMASVISFTDPYTIYNTGTTTDGDYELVDNNPNFSIDPIGSPRVGTVTFNTRDYLEIARVSGSSGSADIYYTGDGAAEWSDFEGGVGFAFPRLDNSDPTSDSLRSSTGFGVVLRSSSATRAGLKYYIYVSPAGGDHGQLSIWWAGSSADGFNRHADWNQLDHEELSALSTTGEYWLSFKAEGDEIWADLYEVNTTTGEVGATALASVHTDEATHRSSGYIGLRGGRYSAVGQGVMFRDLEVIPEPHTMGLILLGLGAVALRRRLR